MNKELLLESGYRLTALKVARNAGLYLIGEFMHGDADAYTKSDLEIESLEELEAIGKYLDWRNQKANNSDISYRQRGNYQEYEKDFYSVVGEEWRKDYLWEGISDWWERDVTSGGDIHAELKKTTLIYSDGQHEWEVKK